MTLVFTALWLLFCLSAGIVAYRWLINYAGNRATKDHR